MRIGTTIPAPQVQPLWVTRHQHMCPGVPVSPRDVPCHHSTVVFLSLLVPALLPHHQSSISALLSAVGGSKSGLRQS